MRSRRCWVWCAIRLDGEDQDQDQARTPIREEGDLTGHYNYLFDEGTVFL